jgi:hypothetical protein
MAAGGRRRQRSHGWSSKRGALVCFLTSDSTARQGDKRTWRGTTPRRRGSREPHLCSTPGILHRRIASPTWIDLLEADTLPDSTSLREPVALGTGRNSSAQPCREGTLGKAHSASLTTGKTAFAVRQKICRALSIGRTAKATLCRAPTPRRTAPINARCRSLCRASLPRHVRRP